MAQAWLRFSETEPEPKPTPEAITICSTSAAGGQGLVAFTSLARYEPGKLMLSSLQSSQLNLFLGENRDIVAVSPRGEVLVIENKVQQEGVERWDPWLGSSLLLGSANLQAVVAYLNRKPLVYAYSPSEAVDEETSVTAVLSKFGTLDFWFATRSAESEDSLEALRAQVRALYDEFVRWPGSYNQLLLAGSLDYCRSAITKLKRSPANVQDEVSAAIRSFYGLCSGIHHQYREAKAALKRVSLQYLQDKFDLLQETCARSLVYPRLEDLDPMDIPRD